MTRVRTDGGLESGTLAAEVSVVRSRSARMIFLRQNQYNFLTDRMCSLKEKEQWRMNPKVLSPGAGEGVLRKVGGAGGSLTGVRAPTPFGANEVSGAPLNAESGRGWEVPSDPRERGPAGDAHWGSALSWYPKPPG